MTEADILHDWYRDFAISGQNTLEQLSSVVLKILDWDPNDLYEFRIGDRLYADLTDLTIGASTQFLRQTTLHYGFSGLRPVGKPDNKSPAAACDRFNFLLPLIRPGSGT